MSPGTESIRTERRKERRELCAPCPVAREKFLRRFRVREIQATFPCQKKFAADRCHGIVEIDLRACGTRRLRGHESSRSSADNDNLHLFSLVWLARIIYDDSS